jgi:hypothetical protein
MFLNCSLFYITVYKIYNVFMSRLLLEAGADVLLADNQGTD